MATTKLARHRGDPRGHVLKIGERVDEKWRAWHGHGDVEVPVSVVAVLSLVNPPVLERDAVASELIGLAPDVFADTVRRLWRHFVRARPDLVNRAWPLIEPWLGDRQMTPETARDAHAVAIEVLRRDLFALTDETRWEVDLLGVVLTLVRTKSAWQARGQYYTPPEVTTLMARLSGTPVAGESVNDPACGTGGMFRAVAELMREAGDDPATVSWEGNDLDHLAIACCAINVVLWGLGTDVLLGVGDTLAADWRERAIAERNEPVILMRQLEGLQLLKNLETAMDSVAEDDAP
ncbi:MAG TPA: N-6 DNA methylase [Pseudonocardiaceae bacterium]|jgi:hypothetical protein